MEEQRPGQVFAPQSNGGDEPASQPVPEGATSKQPPQGEEGAIALSEPVAAPATEPIDTGGSDVSEPATAPVAPPKTPGEIAQIDSAMQQQPPPPIQPEESVVTYSTGVPEESPLEAQGQSPLPGEDDRHSDAPEPYGPDEEPVLEWQAAEPADGINTSSRQVVIYGVAGALVAASMFIISGFNFSTFLGAFVILLGITAFIVSNRQHGHIEYYTLFKGGIAIGERYYPFNELRTCEVINTGGARSLELVPTKRFMPWLSVHLEPTTEENVLELLAEHLPFEEREPDVVERISRHLKL